MRLPQEPIWVNLATAIWLMLMPVGVSASVYIEDLDERRSYFGWEATTILILMVTLLFAVPIGAITVSSVRSYNPLARLTAWRSDRQFASILATAIFGLLALALLWCCLVLLLQGGVENILIGIWFAGWTAWALVMRALYVDRDG